MSSYIENIVVRDPDGRLQIELFVNGEPVDSTEFIIDAGAGWEWEDWVGYRDYALEQASSQSVLDALKEAFDDPPGSEHINGKPDNVPWVP